MAMKLPQRDAGAAHVRKTVAARRVGIDNQCACGESRPEALIAGSSPMMCAACKRKKDGKTIMDNHHIAGKSNSPITIAVPVNEHRAELTVAQQDWPKETLENPDGSPLRAGAARIRGFIDTHIHLIKTFLLWVADMLEMLDTLLVGTLGPKWWEETDLNQFAPERKSDREQSKSENKPNEKP